MTLEIKTQFASIQLFTKNRKKATSDIKGVYYLYKTTIATRYS